MLDPLLNKTSYLEKLCPRRVWGWLTHMFRKKSKGGEHLHGYRWPTARKTHFCASPAELSSCARGTDTLKSSSTGFKLSSAPSHKDYNLCVTAGSPSVCVGGGEKKQVGNRQKEREGWIKLDPPVPKELTIATGSSQALCKRKDTGNPRVGNVESPQWRRKSRSDGETLTSALQYSYCGKKVKK